MKKPTEICPPWDEPYLRKLEYLFSLRRRSKKRDLSVIRRVLRYFGDPQESYLRVQVAGTNGKGSTSAFLDGMLRGGGYRTGLFTSPHLVDFHERFRISGVKSQPDEIEPLLGEVLGAWERLGFDPVFFDVITVLAALYFAEKQVDVAIFEVGIGGAKDATSAVGNQVSLLTQVGLDHTAYLGEQLEGIAYEKAGIFRPSGWAVVGETSPEPLRGIAKRFCELSPEPLLLIGRDFPDLSEVVGEDGEFYRAERLDELFPRPDDSLISEIFELFIPFIEAVEDGWRPPLFGKFQLRNLSVALAGLGGFNRLGFSVSSKDAFRGVELTEWPGRFQRVFFDGLPLILDGAHNPSAARALADSLGGRSVLIFGAMSDKDVGGILRALLPKVSALIAVPINSPRSLSPPEILALARRIAVEEGEDRRGVIFEGACDLSQAFRIARSLRGGEESVLVCGSLYLIGEVLGLVEMSNRMWSVGLG